MRVWVTRTQPAADATAARLRALGHDPVVDPVLDVQPIEAAIDLAGVDALAFTSRNGVEAFAALTREGRALPVFTVGDATADAARACGFTTVHSAEGDVAALAERIASAHPGAVLHAAAREPAGDLAGLLRKRGVAARTVAVYDTVPVEPTQALAQLATFDTVLRPFPQGRAPLVRPDRARRRPAAVRLYLRGGRRAAAGRRPRKGPLGAVP